jgi:hypothetical protein
VSDNGRLTEPLSVGLLKCPNCGAPLYEMPPTIEWKRYFECRECTQTYHFEGRVVKPKRKRVPRMRWTPALVQGRVPNKRPDPQ